MRILFVAPYVPDLVRVRPYNLIRALTARGHQITVLTLWTTEAEKEAARQLQQHCHEVVAVQLPRRRSWWNCLLALPGSEPLQAAYCWQPQLLQQLVNHSHLRELPFDAIHVEHLRGARFGLALKAMAARRGLTIPVVWDSVDCISLLFRQTAARSNGWRRRLLELETRRTAAYESRLLRRFDHTTVTSALDAEALLALAGLPKPPIAIVTNGVDLDYFKPDETVARAAATLVISGKMSYHANVAMSLFCVQEVMPRLWAVQPDIQLWIVGKDPPREILALRAHANVTVTGAVADIRPYLQRATLAIAPITYGAGVQNKVLEALACATPVVATPQAASALQAIPGHDIVVAAGAAEIAQAILQLLDDPRQRRAVGVAGRRYIESYHHWGRTAVQLEEIYCGINPIQH
jgi:polysaccharide biosynthesis protein PslH